MDRFFRASDISAWYCGSCRALNTSVAPASSIALRFRSGWSSVATGCMYHQQHEPSTVILTASTNKSSKTSRTGGSFVFRSAVIFAAPPQRRISCRASTAARSQGNSHERTRRRTDGAEGSQDAHCLLLDVRRVRAEKFH